VRLPRELGELFTQWLRVHYPERADRVLHLLREIRGGRLNDPRCGHRMRGEGPYAALLARRAATRRLQSDFWAYTRSVLVLGIFAAGVSRSRHGRR